MVTKRYRKTPGETGISILSRAIFRACFQNQVLERKSKIARSGWGVTKRSGVRRLQLELAPHPFPLPVGGAREK